MTDSRHGLSILYIAVFLLALNGLFSKVIPLDAVSVTQLRSVLAAITLVLFALLRSRAIRLNGIKQVAGVYFIGVIMGLHWISFFHSMQVSTVAIGMLSLFTYPIITVLLEPLYTKKRIYISDVVAGVLVLFGVLLMLKDDIQNVDSSTMQGVIWGVVSAFLFSVRNLFQKYYFAEVSSDSLILHQVVAISLMLFCFVDFSAVTALSDEGWIFLVLLGVISTATAHSLLSFSLKQLEAKSVAMISCLQPLIATLFAWMLIGEVPASGVLMGGFIIISVALYESVKKAGMKKLT